MNLNLQIMQMCCQNCGGDIIQISSNRWKCQNCSCLYDDTSAEKQSETMHQLFDNAKQELISNLRRNLYDAVNAQYISNNTIRSICASIKQYIPCDFVANFYEVATGNNVKAITEFIRTIDVNEYYPLLDHIIPFLVRSIQTEFLLELNNLVERAYKKTDLSQFEHYSTLISEEAVKVQTGIYETRIPRDVFVAYSSKDMTHVSKLVEVLEEDGFSCFVAARNLRHGKGAVENYDRALKEAMEHCKTFVFVSSTNSRSFDCDALTIEIEHIRSIDIHNAPPEMKNHYASIPQEYKKPRVEYRLEESKHSNAADSITQEFFSTYERVYKPQEVSKRVYQQIYQTFPSKTNPLPSKTNPLPPKTNPIRNICSYASRDFDHAFPSDGEYTDIINRDKYNIIYFHVNIRSSQINRSKIKKDIVIYDENNNIVFDDISEIEWSSNYDRLSTSWIIKARDGEFVKTGLYRAEISIDDFPAQEYFFRVISNSTSTSVSSMSSSRPQKVPHPHNMNGVSTKNPWVTLLLCFFFGSYGIHNFYVGKNKKGIFYLLTCGGLGILPLIDFFCIIAGKFKDNQGFYIKFKKSNHQSQHTTL